jgi:molybdate transport system substrate-binding protein
MQNALDDINAAFTKNTDVKVIAGYAASSALIKQIAQGAAADVFASANLEWMDFGSRRKLIKDDRRVNLLGNQLVLIAPKDSKLDSVAIWSCENCGREIETVVNPRINAALGPNKSLESSVVT